MNTCFCRIGRRKTVIYGTVATFFALVGVAAVPEGLPTSGIYGTDL